MKYLAGIDLGGTKCAAVIAKQNGESLSFLCRKEVKTAGKWTEVLDILIGFIKTEAAKYAITVSACGISAGGPLDGKRGVILNPPNLMSFENAPVVEYVSAELKCPAALQNDADACALAEWKFGAGRGAENIIFLTFGTGLGAGLILNGKLYTGAKNLAGEVGHIRLEKDGPIGYRKAGSFEGFCSGGGIKQLIKLRLNENFDAKELCFRAEKGDKNAIAVFEEIGDKFGAGLAVLVDILNPEVIVAGSIFTRAYDFIYPSAVRALEREALPNSLDGLQLVAAQLGEKIGDYAAAAIAAAI
ncbi:MAG: ROK family protein [Christensenellaceae bacterium]|jgi:glucokinase|nr:ROK family protein [Christensenellaceae bacterium]